MTTTVPSATQASHPSGAQGEKNGHPYLARSKTQVMAAMGSNIPRLEQLWQEEFDPLVTLIGWATAPLDERLAEIEASVKAEPKKSTLVVLTERDDDARQYTAAAKVGEICDRAGSPVHFLFSGGNYYNGAMAEYGEEPAPVMKERFLSLAKPADYSTRCTAEQMCTHTGHQGRLIGSTIRSIRYRRVVVVAPTVHIVRFMLTYNFDLRQHGGADSLEQFAVAIGEWQRMLRRRLTHAQEAFEPILEVGDPRLISDKKRVGGEYAERLHPEVSEDPSKWCAAEKPSLMCERLGIRV